MSELSSQQRQQILAALQNGKNIQAIKLYRDATNSSLADAKHFIESLLETLTTGAVPDATSELTDATLQSRVIELLSNKQKIAAVKEYREATGVGLKDAKEAVEAIGREHGTEPAKGSGCGTAVLVFVALFVVYAV